ncbi:hypothetical protein ACA910_000059 [Epithemia clementina (nom. ined.)]
MSFSQSSKRASGSDVNDNSAGGSNKNPVEGVVSLIHSRPPTSAVASPFYSSMEKEELITDEERETTPRLTSGLSNKKPRRHSPPSSHLMLAAGSTFKGDALLLKDDEKFTAAASKSREKAKRAVSRKRPSRPLSAYNLFFREERQRLLDGKQSVEEIYESEVASQTSESARPKDKFQTMVKVVSNRWNLLGQKMRKKYEAMAKIEMDKYQIKLKEFRLEEEKKVNSMLSESKKSADAAASVASPLEAISLPKGSVAAHDNGKAVETTFAKIPANSRSAAALPQNGRGADRFMSTTGQPTRFSSTHLTPNQRIFQTSTLDFLAPNHQLAQLLGAPLANRERALRSNKAYFSSTNSTTSSGRTTVEQQQVETLRHLLQDDGRRGIDISSEAVRDSVLRSSLVLGGASPQPPIGVAHRASMHILDRTSQQRVFRSAYDQFSLLSSQPTLHAGLQSEPPTLTPAALALMIQQEQLVSSQPTLHTGLQSKPPHLTPAAVALGIQQEQKQQAGQTAHLPSGQSLWLPGSARHQQQQEQPRTDSQVEQWMSFLTARQSAPFASSLNDHNSNLFLQEATLYQTQNPQLRLEQAPTSSLGQTLLSPSGRNTATRNNGSIFFTPPGVSQHQEHMALSSSSLAQLSVSGTMSHRGLPPAPLPFHPLQDDLANAETLRNALNLPSSTNQQQQQQQEQLPLLQDTSSDDIATLLLAQRLLHCRNKEEF